MKQINLPYEPREKDIETECCAILREHGCLTPKWTNPYDTGWPDRIIIPRHKDIFFIEFKAPGKGPSPKQQEKIGFIRERGSAVYVVDSIDDLEYLIQAEGL